MLCYTMLYYTILYGQQGIRGSPEYELNPTI